MFGGLVKTFSRKKEKLVTMGIAAMFRGIWKARNMVCFVNKWPSEPIEMMNRIFFGLNGGQICRYRS
jgi:hypothetical protein